LEKEKIMEKKSQVDDALDVESAFNSIGLSMYSDLFAARLMAWLLVFGGNYEATTQNQGLLFAIKACQKKLNIFGGEVPKGELLSVFRKSLMEIGDNGVNVDWVQEIFKRYNLVPPKSGCDSFPEYQEKKPKND
jgi:hypothetical protein